MNYKITTCNNTRRGIAIREIIQYRKVQRVKLNTRHVYICGSQCNFRLEDWDNSFFRKENWFTDCIWNVMAHAQKPYFVFRGRNGRVHLNLRGRQFSGLLAGEVCASAVVMLDTPCSEVVWRVLATHSIRQFPIHFHSRASPCAITFQLDSTYLTTHRHMPNAKQETIISAPHSA